jgi:anti-sigma B factor antagonist
MSTADPDPTAEPADSFAVQHAEADTARLIGELDIGTVPTFQAAFASYTGSGPLTLDLSELTFIDSSGLTGLVRLHHRLNGTADIVLARPQANVRRILSITRLDQVFTVLD